MMRLTQPMGEIELWTGLRNPRWVCVKAARIPL